MDEYDNKQVHIFTQNMDSEHVKYWKIMLDQLQMYAHLFTYIQVQ